jgi:hypothetical protein
MIEHRNEKGELHRTDGPAVERPNGYREWWVEGKPHRVDGPAIEWANGDRSWWVEGKLHRVDGPAIEWANGGYREWWVEGKPHRVDGPAIEYADGTRAWFVNDKRHRVDGPAVAKELKEKNSEIEQLREALRFYAEWGIDAPAVDAIIEEDRGDKARAALNIVLADLENGD